MAGEDGGATGGWKKVIVSGSDAVLNNVTAASFSGDGSNLTNLPTGTSANNATITISAGNALTGGASFTTNQSSNETITINHQDTSTQASSNNSGRTYIQDITLDTYGHVTGLATATETVVNTDTNTTYLLKATQYDGGNTDPYLKLDANSGTDDLVQLSGGGATTVTRNSDGQITISSTDTNTTYSLPAATATTRGGIELASNTVQTTAAGTVTSTAQRTYGLQVNSAGQGVVNVPWQRTRLQFNSNGFGVGDFTLVDGVNASFKHQGGTSYSVESSDTTYTADGNYGLTLSGTTFRLEDDRRRNSSTTDIKTGNTHDYTWYDADVGIRWYVQGAEDMRLQNGGTLQVDGDVVAYSTTISDERLKDNVTTIENSLDKIKALRGVEYDWNAGSRKGKRDLGLIAQEVEKVIPNIVHEHEQPFLNDDENDKTLYKTVDYEKMVAVLIEGMKEQQSQIDELKSEINQLKGKV